MIRMSPKIALGTLMCLIAVPAQAHLGGHTSGFIAGIAHPFFGLDHLLAMIAVGLWASWLGERAIWVVPLTFVWLTALAALLGIAGAPLPMVEGGIAMSVLVLGLLIAFTARVNTTFAASLVASFAVFHGFAHGTEMPAFAAAGTYGIGFVISTVLLHGLGIGLGLALRNRVIWLRAIGTAVAASGSWWLLAATQQ